MWGVTDVLRECLHQVVGCDFHEGVAFQPTLLGSTTASLKAPPCLEALEQWLQEGGLEGSEAEGRAARPAARGGRMEPTLHRMLHKWNLGGLGVTFCQPRSPV